MSPPSRALARTWGIPLLFCAGGLLLAHHVMLCSGLREMQGDLGDGRFVNYILEHGYRSLGGWKGHRHFWSPPFFWPARNVAAYSEVMLGAAPAYWIWRLLGAAYDTAFQLFICTVSLLNFATAFLAFRDGFRLSPLAASTGAALFAYAGPRVAQATHVQLFPQFWSMICLWALTRLFACPNGAWETSAGGLWISVFALAVAGQLLASFYLGWFLLLATAVALLWASLLGGMRKRLWTVARRHWFAAVPAAITSVLVLLPMASHFLRAGAAVGGRSFAETRSMIPTFRAWIFHDPVNWLYGWTSRSQLFQHVPMAHEQHLAIGYVTAAAAVIALWRGRARPAVQLVALVAVTLLLLAVKVHGFTPWIVVYRVVPAGNVIRAVARIVMVVLIAVALGVALAIDELERRRHPLLALALAAFCLLEQRQASPAYDKYENRRTIAAIARRLDPGCTSFVFSPVGGTEPNWKYHLDAMWAALESGIPTLNGYSGNTPPGWALGDANLRTADDEVAIARRIRLWARRSGLDTQSLCWLKVAVADEPAGAPSDGRDGAALVAELTPPTMQPGKRYRVAITVRNTGGTAWEPAAAFALGSEEPLDTTRWGVTRIPLPEAVPPGGSLTYRFDVVAPSEPGSVPFAWRMRHEERPFGDVLTGDVRVTPTGALTPP